MQLKENACKIKGQHKGRVKSATNPNKTIVHRHGIHPQMGRLLFLLISLIYTLLIIGDSHKGPLNN
jgi:hypothetical protein